MAEGDLSDAQAQEIHESCALGCQAHDVLAAGAYTVMPGDTRGLGVSRQRATCWVSLEGIQ